MHKITSKKISNFLKPNTQGFQQVLNKAVYLDALNQAFKGFVSPSLKANCLVANATENQLIILVSNAALATELRFQTYDLLQTLKTHSLFKDIKTITLKVRPFAPPQSKRLTPEIQRKVPLLQPQTAKIMLDCAETIEDAALRAVMLKLAKHTK
ncbi:MAG: DUF721 domain-containing protein [Gammaproteobacteria bacterium]|nr:DUF721 domain-containing protein [Gammaproteobacteria bacterium]